MLPRINAAALQARYELNVSNDALLTETCCHSIPAYKYPRGCHLIFSKDPRFPHSHTEALVPLITLLQLLRTQKLSKITGARLRHTPTLKRTIQTGLKRTVMELVANRGGKYGRLAVKLAGPTIP